MKIVVIGGSGLIGCKVVDRLRALGHEAVSASPRSGVNAVTGKGLSEALKGASVVVDVSNSPSFEEKAALEFFEKSAVNLATAERSTGVKHHVALSVVGVERMPDLGYMRAKVAQEKLIKVSGVPYTILRATQFFEFLDGIAASGTEGNTVRLPPALFQPVAADDVADAMAGISIASPVNGTIELGGHDKIPMDELIRRYLKAKDDPRIVVMDPEARYFGGAVDDRSLVPGKDALIGPTRLERWLSAAALQA